MWFSQCTIPYPPLAENSWAWQRNALVTRLNCHACLASKCGRRAVGGRRGHGRRHIYSVLIFRWQNIIQFLFIGSHLFSIKQLRISHNLLPTWHVCVSCSYRHQNKSSLMRHSKDFKYLHSVLLLPFSRRRRRGNTHTGAPLKSLYVLCIRFCGCASVRVCLHVCWLVCGCLWVPRF